LIVLFAVRVASPNGEQAPIFGHGTGSTKAIFADAAKDKEGEWANTIRNPHNQTLYVAIQWGLVGTIVLFAMWYAHLSLFFGQSIMHWIGLIVVSQNIVSSTLNSHLFDFHEGWLYVRGVGVASGAIKKVAAPIALGNVPWADVRPETVSPMVR
jgi:O-antigen ligase